MKKGRLFLMLALFLIFPVQAGSVTLGIYEKGILVPLVRTDGDSIDTVVAIFCDEDTRVWWTLFNEKGQPIMDNFFPCGANGSYVFSANHEARNSHADAYLVFTANGASHGAGISDRLQNDHKRIFGNAFYVDVKAGTSASIPAIPLSFQDYKNEPSGIRLRSLHSDSITGLKYGLNFVPFGSVDFRYCLDPEIGTSTEFIIWTTACLEEHYSSGNMPDACSFQWIQRKRFLYCSVTGYDEHGTSRNLKMPLGCRLTRIKAENILYPHRDFKKGFIRISARYIMPRTSGAIGFCLLKSDASNLFQTLLAGQKSSVLVPYPPVRTSPKKTGKPGVTSEKSGE